MVREPQIAEPEDSRSGVRLEALSAAEREALAAVLRGTSNKAAAYELGITESALSQRLRSAACKVGLGNRTELVRAAAMAAPERGAELDQVPLTPSEQQVLELVSRGLSNADIAQIRSRSARTVANQVAALLRKTGAPTRRALVVKTTAIAFGTAAHASRAAQTLDRARRPSI